LVSPGPSPAYSRINITAPASPTTLHTSAYEDGTEGSETSAYINQTLGNYPKGNLLYSVHGESLKSRILLKVTDAPIQVSNISYLTVSFKFLKFSFHTSLVFVPEMSASFKLSKAANLSVISI